MKKLIYIAFAAIGILAYPLIALTLLLMEKLCSIGWLPQAAYCLSASVNRILVGIYKSVWIDTFPEKVFLENTSAIEERKKNYNELCAIYHTWREAYKVWAKEMANQVCLEVRTMRSRRLIVDLNRDSAISFYKGIFAFLDDYADAYRIVPERLPVDKGIMRITIRIAGFRAKDFTADEIQTNFTLRLVSALSSSDQLYGIPAGYWDDAVFFPHLLRNAGAGTLVVLIALSEFGEERLRQLREEEAQTEFCQDTPEAF